MPKLAAGLVALVLLATACASPSEQIAEGIRALQQEQHDEAIALFEQVLANGDTTAEESLLARNGLADAHFALNNFAEAAENYTLLLDEVGPDRVVHNNRGLTYHHLGLYEEAVADFNRAEALAAGVTANDFILYYNRAGSLDALGRLEEAKNDLNTALMLNPNFPQAFLLRSLINADLGMEEEARADAERARELGLDEGAPVRPDG